MVFFNKFVVLFLTVLSVILNKSSFGAPHGAVRNNNELNIALDNFLNIYYDKYIKNSKHEEHLLKKNSDGHQRINEKSVDIYDTMQGDQPVNQENNANLRPPATNFTGNTTEITAFQVSRNRTPTLDDENRTRDNWIQTLKMNILREVGRANSSITLSGDAQMSAMNLTKLFPHNETNPVADLISKKIRTFYPSCSIPDAAEQEFRNEDKLMNLYFNYTGEDQNNKIATATLRLHMMQNSTTPNTRPKNCTTSSNEEEKLLRVSIYWYMKPQRNKRRGKKRLCDSRVIPENARWVELNVANAIKSWTKEQNLGLAVQVEDQDGRTLKADKYFKGPTCLQPPNPSQPSSWTTQELRNSFSDYWVEIQLRPFLVIYYCFPPLIFVPWDSP